MGWKRNILETAVWMAGGVARSQRDVPENPKRIFVLRNNDIGDLLVVTPLFEALRRRFPGAEILAGIGDWNRPVLEGNPHVDRIIPVNAPWHNQQVRPQNLAAVLRYLASSPEGKALALERCDIGIDVLGSAFGSLLLMRAGIPFRVGVRGYAGGHTAAQRAVEFSEQKHVGAQALEIAGTLGFRGQIENRPQIYLNPEPCARSGGIVMAPGGGFEAKRWPPDAFAALAAALRGHEIHVVGGPQDRSATELIRKRRPDAHDHAGRVPLRETFRIIAESSLVICNSSMAMHVAAAFRRPCLVLLGEHFVSASAHAAQWGYPETAILGPEPGNARIASVEEACRAAERLLQATNPAPNCRVEIDGNQG